MKVPAVRRRFVWPADDLVTMNLRTDGVVERVLARVTDKSPMFTPEDFDASSTVAVVGFPRSANTLLTMWLSSVVKPGVVIIDGRDSHSTLDLHRISDAGIPVVIPVRAPVDACASMMVRKGLHRSEAYGRQILRAYSAWHSVAGRILHRDDVTVASFTRITTEPSSLANEPSLARHIDAAAVARLSHEALIERTRTSLADVVGQGLPQDGIAAHLMISLPEPARSGELSQARAILESASLRETRLSATHAYESFLPFTKANELQGAYLTV